METQWCHFANNTKKKEYIMRAKAVFVFAAILVFVLALSPGAFGQIRWFDSPDGVALSSKVPGVATTITLKFIIGQGQELTNGQWLELDLSSFQVDPAQVTLAKNYSFQNTYASSHMDSTADYTVTYNSTNGYVTISLVNENALVPADSIVLVISNVLYNKGNAAIGYDYQVRIHSFDQPQFSPDYNTDKFYATANDLTLNSVTVPEVVASTPDYITFNLTTVGRIPKNGILKVLLPAGFTYNSSLYDSVKITVNSSSVTKGTVSAVSNVLSIPLNTTSDIATGSTMVINVGTATGKLVNNAAIFTGTTSDTVSTRTYTNATDFRVYAFDAEGDTIAVDKNTESKTYTLYSNWFPGQAYNSGQGGIIISDNTAGNYSPWEIYFKVSSVLDSTASVCDTLVFYFPTSNFKVSYSAATKSKYTFSTGFTSTSLFNVIASDSASGRIKFVPSGSGSLPRDTIIKLTIATGVVKNLGATGDFSLGLRTSEQTTYVYDRETDPIMVVTGGLITALVMADSNASEVSAIDSLVFTIPTELPGSAKFVIQVPPQFTLSSSIDTVNVYIQPPGQPEYPFKYERKYGKVSPISIANNTIANNQIIIKLSGLSDSTWAINTRVKIELGDTTGKKIGGSAYNPAFTNPSVSYAGNYPTAGSYSGFRILVYSDSTGVAGNELLAGDNTNAVVPIKTNNWGLYTPGTWRAHIDTQAVFVRTKGFGVSGTDTAGRYTGLRLFFSLGSMITTAGTLAPDTLYLNLGQYFQIDQTEATRTSAFINHTQHLTFYSGARDNDVTDGLDFDDLNFKTSYNSSTGVLAIVFNTNDSLVAAQNIVMQIDTAGLDASRPYGILANKGTNSNIRLSFWTSRQHTPVTMDSTCLVVKPDSVQIYAIAKSDSVAGAVSSDSLYFYGTYGGKIGPGSYMIIQLDTGNTFSSSISASNISIVTGNPAKAALRTLSNFTLSRLDDNNVKITLGSGDTLGLTELNTSGFRSGGLDTVRIYFGGDKIINELPVRFSDRVLEHKYLSPTFNKLYYKISIYDSDGALMFAHKLRTTPVHSAEQIHTVSNYFPTIATADTIKGYRSGVPHVYAGQPIDSLFIPFKVGRKIIGDGSTVKLELTFHGAVYTSKDSAEKHSHYRFQGDTAGVNYGHFVPTYTNVSASNDSVITILFGAGDQLGGNSFPHATAFTDTLVIYNVITALGMSGTDGLDVDLKVYGIQTTTVSDNSNVTYNITNTTMNLSSLATGGPVSQTAGDTTNFYGGWNSGTEHGTLFGDGKVRFKIPVKQDSTATHSRGEASGTGVYQYKVNGGSVAAGDFLVFGNASGVDTISVGTPTYDNTTYADTVIITVPLTDKTKTITSSADLVVYLKNNKLINPAEATEEGNGSAAVAPGTFANNPARDDDYQMAIELLDRNGNLISRGISPIGWSDFAPASATQMLVLLSGQKHDPGGISSGGSTSGATAVTAGNGVTFVVLAVDRNYNVVDVNSVNISMSTHSGSGAADGSNLRYIGDQNNGGTAGNLTFTNGVAAFSHADSLKIFQAGDNNTLLGRNYSKNIRATYVSGTPSLATSTSDPLVVNTAAMSKLVTIVEGYETLLQGDSVNYGKSVPTPFQVSQKSTYTVKVYPVDKYYNRTATRHGNTASLTVSAPGMTTTLPTDRDFDATTYTFTFTVKPLSQGSGQTIVITDVVASGNPSASSTFDVIAAITTAVFAALNDSTEAAGRTMPFSVNLTYSGTFGTNDGWYFYLHSVPGFKEMNISKGGSLKLSGIKRGESGVMATFDSTINTRDITKGTYYIYVTIPASNDSVVAQSEGFIVRHEPYVDQDMTTTDGRKIFPSARDSILNSGGGIASANIKYSVIDLDNSESEVPVWIFLNTSSTLTKYDFNTTLYTFGTGSIPISPAQGQAGALNRGDTTLTFDIVKYNANGTVSSYTTAGSYYVYVVAYDGNKVNVGRSNYKITVKHAPSIALDRPVAGTTIVNTANQQNVTVNWSTSGDIDIDDNAIIAIYADTASKNHTTASALLASTTKKSVTGGFTLYENGDTFTDDQYVWDLRNVSSANLPTSGGIYYFYALIKDNTDTTIAKSLGSVQFLHNPKFQFNFNLGTGVGKGADASVSQVTVDQGQVLRVNFDAFDLDQTQYIRLFVSQLDTAYNDYENLEAALGTGQAWLMNSSSGLLAGVQTLTTVSSYMNWYSENMSGLTGVSKNGNYYIYAFVTNNGFNTTWNNATTEKFVANGKVRLTGRERPVDNWDLRIVPNIISTTKNDRIRFDVMLDTKSEDVEEVAFYLNVDTTLFSIVDSSNPFKFSSSGYFFGSVSAVENRTVTSGGYYQLNFQKVSVPGGSGTDTLVCYFEMTAKDNDSSGTLNKDIYFANEYASGRYARLSNNGVQRIIPVPTPAIKVMLNPLGRVQGRVPLQIRINHSKQITLELRKIGSLNPIDDAGYIAVNDKNLLVSGVQFTTDRDGFFELNKVPNGTYYLVAKTGGYLSGQTLPFSIVAGDILVGYNPTYNNASIPENLQELKGGDVSSGSAAGYQDDVVDGSDINYIVTNFNKNIVTYPLYAIGDIDGNGIIDFQDLSVTSANYLLRGIPPYGSKVNAGKNASARLALYGIPNMSFKGQEFTVGVRAENVDDLFGYVFTINFDPDEVELINNSISEGDFLKTRPGSNQTIFFTKPADRGTMVVSILLGNNGKHVAGSGVISNLRFRSKVQEVHPDIRLLNAKIANSGADVQRLGDVVQVPSQYQLLQNYPNPFNPETKIRFELPKTSRVTLKIYNVLGQEVATLINTDMKAGYHLVKWNGRNQFGIPVASGIYFYKLETPEFSKIMKMMLIK